MTIPDSYPTISGSATAVSLSGISDYFQRLCAPDPFEANVLADQANTYGITSVAIAVEDGDAYSAGLATAFQTSFGSGAATLINFTANDPDYATKLTQLLAGNPEAIFISMLNPNVFVEFITELGNIKGGQDLANTTFILCDGLYSTDLFQALLILCLVKLMGIRKILEPFLQLIQAMPCIYTLPMNFIRNTTRKWHPIMHSSTI